MYKRRDWLLTRGADGGGDETSSSSSEGLLRYKVFSMYSLIDLSGDHLLFPGEPLTGEVSFTSSEESPDEEHPSSYESDSIPSQFARLEDISEDDLSGSEDEIIGDDEDGAHAKQLKIELKDQLQ
jgi:hypothetical protein